MKQTVSLDCIYSSSITDHKHAFSVTKWLWCATKSNVFNRNVCLAPNLSWTPSGMVRTNLVVFRKEKVQIEVLTVLQMTETSFLMEESVKPMFNNFWNFSERDTSLSSSAFHSSQNFPHHFSCVHQSAAQRMPSRRDRLTECESALLSPFVKFTVWRIKRHKRQRVVEERSGRQQSLSVAIWN